MGLFGPPSPTIREQSQKCPSWIGLNILKVLQLMLQLSWNCYFYLFILYLQKLTKKTKLSAEDFISKCEHSRLFLKFSKTIRSGKPQLLCIIFAKIKKKKKKHVKKKEKKKNNMLFKCGFCWITWIFELHAWILFFLF